MSLVDEIKEFFSSFFPRKIPEASVEFAEGIIDNLSGMGDWEPPDTERYRDFVRFCLNVLNIAVRVDQEGTVITEWLEKPEGIHPKLWEDVKRSLGYTYRSIALDNLSMEYPKEIAADFFKIWQTWEKVKEQIISRAKQLQKEKEELDWTALQDIRRVINDFHH